MIKLTLKMLQCAAICTMLFMTACSVEGVATIPAEPGETAIGVSPWPGGVWIAGEWNWNGAQRRYDWQQGYWEHAHRGTWQRGHWQQGRHGNKWQHGRWN